jgi:taurine dioxygenase
MAGLRIRNLDEDYSWGSRVEGLDWSNIHDEGVRAELQALFRARGFIVFEGMEPSGKMQVALSEVFGPLKEHPTATTPRSDESLAPGVIDMHNLPREDDGNYHGLVEVAGVLRAVIAAPERGRTGFCDGIELYRNFDPELRRKAEALSVLYTLDVRLTQMRFGRTFKTFGDVAWQAGNVEEAKSFPRAIHPAVWTRPTGEKVLHVGPWMSVGLKDHEDPAGEALYEEICQEVNRKAHAYWHQWRPTDMLIWDNWRMLHAVEGCDPKYERRMHRTTIKGDYGLGRFEDGKRPGEVYRELAPLALPA